MRSLAQYYFKLIESDYNDWLNNNSGDGVPGRLVLREFDPLVVEALLETIQSSHLPIALTGSESGFIIAVEDHEHYQNLKIEKYSFADLTHERNRVGNFFCLMFIAETKPTHDQVTRIDQSVVFDIAETLQWVNIAKHLQSNSIGFTQEQVKELASFVSELTNNKWNNRPFIKIDKINEFIDHVISDTIRDGLLWDAIGRNCVYLGGINRLDEFRVLKGAGKDFRKAFRKQISNTLLMDIDFWGAIVRFREIDKSEIDENLQKIREGEPEYSAFCDHMDEYFNVYFQNPEAAKELQCRIQQNYDSQAPFSSVLQPKKASIKFKLGEETLQFLADNDIRISDSHLEIVQLVDDKAEKPEKNDLRSFYFTHSKDLSENSKLEKAWLKEISSSKITECDDFVEGLFTVLSKSVFMADIGPDKIQLSLAKDRSKRMLQKKNRDAIEFFFNEYRGLSDFWLLFGENFEIDYPKPFSEDDLLDPSNKELKKGRNGKSANELYFRVIRYSEDPNSPSESWDLKWYFNPLGFESAKFTDFQKVLDRKGYCHKHKISIDPLFVKRSECSPTISNSQMFLSVSTRMKRGELIRKADKEESGISDLLSQLLQHRHLTQKDHDTFIGIYDKFVIEWKNAVDSTLKKPLLVELSSFEDSFNELLEFLVSRTEIGESFRELLYEFITAHTLFVGDNADYAVYLPWSPYSLLMTAQKNKIFRDVAASYKEKRLRIGNKDDGVLSKLIAELNDSYGKSLFLRKNDRLEWLDLVCTQSRFGYFEYTSLANSKNALREKEIRSVIKATTEKFLETFPNERHHLQVMCSGLLSYEHVLTVYDELLKLSEDQEDQISLSITFTCNDRHILDVIYQRICESFDASKIDSNIKVRVVSALDEVLEGEVDLLFSFDPLYTTNVLSLDAPKYVVSSNNGVFWEYCASRKIPSNPITKKSSFALNNHIFDVTAANFQKAFMRCAGKPGSISFCREVAQTELKDEINKGLAKSNWLVIYDYLLCKDTLSLSENMGSPFGLGNRRVLRYVQGEGLKRSLAIITEKETHYITTNLDSSLRKWRIVHPDNISSVVDKIFTLSNSFSSDVLLKSVGNGNFSHDLVGTAGSTVLIQSLLKEQDKIAEIFWVHLDDYIGWFKSSVEDDALKSIGRSVNYLSDLMGMYLTHDVDGKISINIVICESKLINGSVEQTVKSCKQLKSTCELVRSMLETAFAFDFCYWLNKFLEFAIGNFKFSPNVFDFSNLLNLDKENVRINLYGLSVLFHYDNDSIKSDFYKIYGSDYLNQISLSFQDTKKVFKHLLDSSAVLDLDAAVKLTPLELNRRQLERPSTLQEAILEETPSVPESSPEPVEVVAIEEVAEAEEAQTASEDTIEPQYSRSEHLAVRTSADGKSVLDLIYRCLAYLDSNTEIKEDDPIDVEHVKTGVRKILSHSNLPSNFSDTLITPNSIVIKLLGDVNLNASKITNMRGTFLSVVGLSLRQVYPESGVMVLVFDRDKRQTVHFSELIKSTLSERKKTLKDGFNNKILIGQNEFGENCCFFKLDGASPHALVGGQTKSGKSILMNNMITDLIMTNTPENLRLRLFDPKQVEFASYSNSAHLAHSVVLDKEEAVIRLKEAEHLMNERYVQLKDLGLKDIEAYNLRFPDNRMSREVVFFDELADWILDNEFKKNAKDIIVRLSSKGRAAGVHLVLATQRPSNDVVFPLLRANLDTKIALKVDRDLNSEIILGESGAENLLGYGHGIVKTEGHTMSIQVGFTESKLFDGLVELIINYWRFER
ncbi:FtsK/SpoIIIE domain-containing protein [Marinomonas foliarum]|uniref:FtsK/SpoIIIE family protein n=1 Tax=Marinomonas foliarum TaxID=491950 RepID=A0A368ZMT9_9GAMM|nr:FtsK/SpoIIIE domain-containing protein [Marinomonas foliarum]RCW96323.1 FtsK/SpoIIIE family protein [Marinomonas foliarum]